MASPAVTTWPRPLTSYQTKAPIRTAAPQPAPAARASRSPRVQWTTGCALPPQDVRSQAAVSAGSLPSSTGPLATTTSPSGRGTGAAPQLRTIGQCPADDHEGVAGTVDDAHVAPGVERMRTPGTQRLAVELEGRAGPVPLCLDGEGGPVVAAAGSTAGPRPVRSRTARRRRTTGSAPGTRRGPSRRCGARPGPASAPGRPRPPRGRAPRPGRGRTSRAAPASSGSRPGRGPGRARRRRSAWGAG